MSIKLTKKTSVTWMGNGFGNSAATWAIKGHDGWTVWQSSGGDWIASKEDRSVRSYTRAMLVQKLKTILGA